MKFAAVCTVLCLGLAVQARPQGAKPTVHGDPAPASHTADFKPTVYINITNKIVYALNGIIFKLFPIYSHTEQHIPVQSRAGVLCLLKLGVPHGTWSSPLNSKSVLSLVAWLQNYLMPRHCGLWVNSSVHCVQCLEKPFLNSRINDFLTKHSLVQ